MTSIFNVEYVCCNACRACPEYIVLKILNKGKGPIIPFCEWCSDEFAACYSEYKAMSYGEKLCPETLSFTSRTVENPRNRKIPLTISITPRKASKKDIQDYVKKLTKEKNMRLAFERRFLRGFADRGHSLYVEKLSENIHYFNRVVGTFPEPSLPPKVVLRPKAAQPSETAQAKVEELASLFSVDEIEELISSIKQIIDMANLQQPTQVY